MGSVPLSEFKGDSVVVHFGGDTKTISAYTFAHSLIGFADTARAVSASIDPGQEIEILVEAIGPGSFRTVVKRVRKDYGGVFSGPVGIIFWGVVTNVIYDNLVKSPDTPKIVITTEEIVIWHGTHQIIIPRNVYEAAENAKKNPEVQRGLRRTFDPLQKDPNIREFGLTTSISDPSPIVYIHRSEFPKLIESAAAIEEQTTERVKTETARLVILKAWLNHANRKWSFEWNGVPISAPVADPEFLDRLEKREHLIGTGDALDVEITFKQVFEPKLGVHVNDPNSFIVSKVVRHVPRS